MSDLSWLTLGAGLGILVGFGFALLLSWLEDRRTERVELDEAYRNYGSQIRGRIP